jgi:hypothetical protein
VSPGKLEDLFATTLSSRLELGWARGPSQGDEKSFGQATTFYGTLSLSFVIPSEAEGSAVPRTLPENAEIHPQTKLSSRPELSVVERSAVFYLGATKFEV